MARFCDKRKALLETMMKDEVFRAAVDVIKADGLGALTLERIAQDVGVSRGTLYNYFADRGAVLAHIEERLLEPVKRDIEALCSGPATPVDKMSAIASGVLGAVYQNRAVVVALMRGQPEAGPLRESKHRKRSYAIGLISNAIREGIDAGCFRSIPVEAAAEAFWGSIIGFVNAMMCNGNLIPTENMVRDLMDVFLGGLMPRDDIPIPSDAS